MVPFATLNAWVAYLKSVLAPSFTYVSTSFAVSTGAATVYFSSPLTTVNTPFNGQQGTTFIGVPGPDLATGLPILTVAIAYGIYRYMRKAQVAA